MNSIIQEIEKIKESYIELRHDLHKHPELGFEETRTSDIIAKKLQELGYEVHRGFAKTGIVGTLKVGNGNKRLGIRADIDALPIIEHSGKSWSSTVNGKFHGCGHDGHTAILLCAAEYLAKTRHFNGTLHLIFQPAEELLYGGRVMLDDGLFTQFPCDHIFAMHNMPGFEKGKFYFKSGPMMASSDTLHLHVSGVGAHGAMPEKSIDATLTACYIATALQTIVSRNVTPFQPAVITIGCIQSGDAPNVVNDNALMKLTVRTLDVDVRKLVLKRIEDVAKMQAASFGATVTIEHVNASPVLVNDPASTEFAEKIALDLFGQDKVGVATSFMGSEDFAFMLEENPNGSYLMLGAGTEAERCALHNPGYDFNDELIVPAATYWSALTQTYLK